MADASANNPRPINRPAITVCVILAVIMQALDRSCLDPNAEDHGLRLRTDSRHSHGIAA